MRNIVSLLLLITSCLFAFCSEKKEIAEPEKLIELATRFIEMVEQKEFDKAEEMFNSEMKKALPVKKLAEVWTGLLSQLAAYKGQGSTRTEKVKQYDVVHVTCEFEKGTVDARIAFDSEKKIAGFWIFPAEEK